MAPAKGSIIGLSTAPSREMRYGRGRSLSLVGPHVGAENLDVHVNILNRGSKNGPYHLHRRGENVYFVLEGRLRICIDGHNYETGPGDSIFIPPGVPHSASNAGNEEARLLEIYAPADIDFVEVEA